MVQRPRRAAEPRSHAPSLSGSVSRPKRGGNGTPLLGAILPFRIGADLLWWASSERSASPRDQRVAWRQTPGTLNPCRAKGVRLVRKEIIQSSRILIVDDQAANVLLLERILQQGGYTNLIHSRPFAPRGRSLGLLCLRDRWESRQRRLR